MLCKDGDLGDLKRIADYVGEEKYDGTRVLIIKENGSIWLQNREGVNYTIRLPELVQAAKRIQAESFKIDGEGVYINQQGEVEFTPCQRRCATQFPDPFLRQRYPIIHKGFDIMELNGKDLIDTPYLERKAALKDLLKELNSDIHYVPYRTDLEKAFEEVVQRQEEGLILKRLDSGYEGSRSWDWLKVKNWRHTVYQVAGYTPGKNSRSIYFGSLVLVKDGKFIGHVGSGFNEWELRTIKKALDEAQKIDNPFDIGEPWTTVKTDLQVKAKYYKITDSGVMRFPVFEELA